ncbi:MAG TPA: TonB family protein [Terriglobales bacterium]|nr:TonB family protein [Terriglobales bacterium]
MPRYLPILLCLALMATFVSSATAQDVKQYPDILSDTHGYDLSSYLAVAVKKIRQNWFNLIPAEARPPEMKRGSVSIQFSIDRDGQVFSMRLDETTGVTSMDRAAWAGIAASNPFPRLPEDFPASYVRLRIHFYYNPQKSSPPSH